MKKDNCNKFMQTTRWTWESRSNLFITMQQSNWKRMYSKETQKIFIGRNKRMRTRNERRKEIIIAGDYNQHIGGNEIQKCYREIGVQDVLSEWEKASWNVRDVTFKRGSRCADSIARREGLMPFIEGFEEIVEQDEKTSTDYRGHTVEVNL